MKVYSTTCTDEVCTTTCTDASAGGDGEILELLLPIFIIILPKTHSFKIDDLKRKTFHLLEYSS